MFFITQKQYHNTTEVLYMEWNERMESIKNDIADHFRCSPHQITEKAVFSEGRSGDYVCLICVSGTADSEKSGEYILKIANCSSSEDFLWEIDNSNWAKQQFDDTRIRIPLVRFFSAQLQYYVCDVARDCANEFKTFKTLSKEKKSSRLEEFVEKSLFAATATTCSTSISSMMYNWLGDKRLGKGSRLPERIRTLIGDELAPGWSSDSGIKLPNPYYFYITDKLNCSLSAVLQGPQHGDVNQNNILIQPKAKGYNLYLIDFPQYKTNSYLFFDQVYLLVNILLDSDGLLSDWLEHIQSFFEKVKNNGNYEETDEIGRYTSAFRRGMKSFYARNLPNTPNLYAQFLTACVAVGLNYMNKAGLSVSKQIFSFAFSSMALKHLIACTQELTFDSTAFYPPLCTGTDENVASIWSITNNFNASTRFVLLTSCCSDHISADSLCLLGEIPWTAVIETNSFTENELRNIALNRFKQRQGYQYLMLPSAQTVENTKDEAAWISIVIEDAQKNRTTHYRKNISNKLTSFLSCILSKFEAYPLCVFIDSNNLNKNDVHSILDDLLAVAGDKTSIRVINLSAEPLELEEDTNISVHNIPCSLPQIAQGVQICFRKSRHDEILIPTLNGMMVSIDPIIAKEIENHLTIVHRMIIRNSDDDDGDAFYHGSEASWHDIANNKDAPRINYTSWQTTIHNRLSNLQPSCTSLICLYHKPGGGGSTMAKRIMWDFCHIYPTIFLHKISGSETVNHLQKLYKKSENTPLLIIAEINSSSLPLSSISELRIQLSKANVRALLICVSRASGLPNRNDQAFYLPETPDMNMGFDEAESMFNRYRRNLNPETEQDRITELAELTYSKDYDSELRQPFFYGLFAFGEKYLKIDEYVKTNLENSKSELRELLKILSMNTVYTQDVNLNIREIAHFLFPDKTIDADTLDKTITMISDNCFIVHRGSSYRISHPIIANKLLDNLLSDGNRENQMLELAQSFVIKLSKLYTDANSLRLHEILQGVFVNREPITDEERSSFSPFISQFQTNEQRIQMMKFLRDRFKVNPHYSNHLARLYLKPLGHASVSDVKLAEQFALEAIDRAEKNPYESTAIHQHLLGKVYSRKCLLSFKREIGNNKNSINAAISNVQNMYKAAFSRFDACAANGNNNYGLVGKLELISSMLYMITTLRDTSIARLMENTARANPLLATMVAEAGDIMYQYMRNNDDPDPAFRIAQAKFYKNSGRIRNIQHILDGQNLGTKQRSNFRRAMVSILERTEMDSGIFINYDLLDADALSHIKSLMEANIYNEASCQYSDRYRWLEAYRRMNNFDLGKAYDFVCSWPDANHNLDVVYYRYVFAFILYLKHRSIELKEVREHLQACKALANTSYGKNVNSPRNVLGKYQQDSLDSASLCAHFQRDGSDRENRSDRLKRLRDEKCDYLTGHFEKIDGGVMYVRFSPEDKPNKELFAYAPRNEATDLYANQPVKFHLGFSYSGFRALDIIPLE